MTTHFTIKNEGPGAIELTGRGVNDGLVSQRAQINPGEELTRYVWPDIQWEVTEVGCEPAHR